MEKIQIDSEMGIVSIKWNATNSILSCCKILIRLFASKLKGPFRTLTHICLNYPQY